MASSHNKLWRLTAAAAVSDINGVLRDGGQGISMVVTMVNCQVENYA